MPKYTPKVTQQSIRQTQQTGSGPAPKQSTRQSRIRGHHDPNGPGGEVKLDLDPNLLITTQAVTKDDEQERRLDRINDIGKMLRKNGALSKAETKWLRNLHDTDKESYNKIGKLLSVPSFWRPSQHGVSDLGDRNRIRMQTLKAVVHEAFKTARIDNTWQKKQIAVVRAIDKATKVRKAMNARYAGGKKLRIYKMVSRATLQNPDLFYAENNNIAANLDLARQLRRPRNIHSGIRNQSSVANAVKALIDNKLLNANAADKLGKMLEDKNEAYDVNQLMTIDSNDVPHPDDRKKIRSLLLMHLAYYGDTLETFKAKDRLLAKARIDAPESGKGQKRWGRIYESVLYLPASSGLNSSVRRVWLNYLPQLTPPKSPAKRVHESASIDVPASQSPKTEKPADSNVANKTDKKIDENAIIEEKPKASKTDNNVRAKSVPDMTDQKIDESQISEDDIDTSETDSDVPAKDAPAKEDAGMTSEEIASDVLKGIVDNIFKEKEKDKTHQKVADSVHADAVKKDKTVDDMDGTNENKKIVNYDPVGQGYGTYETGDNVFTQEVTKQGTPVSDLTDPQNDQTVFINLDDSNDDNSDYQSSGDYYFNPKDAHVDERTPESQKFRLASEDSDDPTGSSSTITDTEDE